ncbi:HAD hydrolase family protein [Roseateles sp. SL47]|uniref:HAD family hydrolase n=1 Tax=Roseateles sp. SL47 TaxID=2995138 RepID=UPI00227000C0|nr:HAD hydrolase family protein [Roseateles sp. SL47]WAC73558.1 HAD hydrolase family protein [Roseateles sp. SL47]
MKPLIFCSREEWRAVQGVLTDIDDTLTTDGRLAPAAREALQRLAQAGVPVIAITGRPAGWSEPMARDWPVLGIVAENGGVLLRRGDAGPDGVVHADGVHESSANRPVERLFTQDAPTRRQHAARLRQCTDDILARVPGARLATDSAGRQTDIAIDHSEHAHLPPEGIEAVCGIMRAHGLQATVSSIHINGWIGSHNKWTAAEWAVPVLTGRDFDPARWLYVGDSSNDQLMFERLPLTVGVANIRRFLPVLAHLPAYVTEGERGDGFAEVVQALLAARATQAAGDATTAA